MPAASARYDVLYNDGSGLSVGDIGTNRAVVDMHEERMPDDWGDPGKLVTAKLVRWHATHAQSIEYAPALGRMALWVNGRPRKTRATRRFLRWTTQTEDPAPHDDPEWVIPP